MKESKAIEIRTTISCCLDKKVVPEFFRLLELKSFNEKIQSHKFEALSTFGFKLPTNARYALMVDADTTVIWSGCGAVPQDIQDELKYGMKLEDIRI